MHVFHMRVLRKKPVSAKDLEDLSVSGNRNIAQRHLFYPTSSLSALSYCKKRSTTLPVLPVN